MPTTYLVASLEFWEAIPAIRTSVCQRMKFTDHSKETDWCFDTKSEAFSTAQRLRLCLISETKYSDSSWKYQLLLSTQKDVGSIPILGP